MKDIGFVHTTSMPVWKTKGRKERARMRGWPGRLHSGRFSGASSDEEEHGVYGIGVVGETLELWESALQHSNQPYSSYILRS